MGGRAGRALFVILVASAGCEGLEVSGTSDVFPNGPDASLGIPSRDAGATDAAILIRPDARPPEDAAADAAPIDATPDASAPCVPTASVSPVYARQPAAAPQIDGDMSEWPCDAMVRLDASDAAYVVPSADMIHGVFAVAWDAGHFYFAVHVSDPNVVTSNPDLLWTNSAAELYLSGNLASTGDYGPLDHQYTMDAANRATDYGTAQYPPNRATPNPPDLVWAGRRDGDGFTVEAAVAAGAVGLGTFASGSTLGFDVQLDDGDGANQLGSVLWATATRGTCTCMRCCCGPNGDFPYCDVLRFGKVSLQ